MGETKKLKKQNDQNLSEPWDNPKQPNTCVSSLRNKGEREWSRKALLEEILAKYFAIQGKCFHLQIQEAQQTPSRKNIKETIPMHFTAKSVKTKGKKEILKATREKKHITYKWTLIWKKTKQKNLTSLQKQWQPEYNGSASLNCWKDKLLTKITHSGKNTFIWSQKKKRHTKTATTTKIKYYQIKTKTFGWQQKCIQ